MRKMLSLLICMTLLLGLVPAVHATTGSVRDDAGLLSSSQRSSLESRTDRIAEKYDIAVLILTVDSLNGSSTWRYADNYFNSGNFGPNGILLLISMEYRDWEIATYGSVSNMISDRQTEDLFNVMQSDLSAGNYYAAFGSYLSALEDRLSSAEKTYGSNTALQILVSLGIGAVVALIVLLVMRGKMNTVRAQRSATNYMREGSYQLVGHRDLFLYSNTTRVRRAENNGSGGHGGGGRGGSRGKF